MPLRTDADHDRDDTVTATEGGVDLQELTTASEREYAPTGRAWAPPTHRIEDDGFAHVLIDEAQDLTPMQWRMVGRRGRTASWTIVGDPAQSSWPVPAESAAARAEALEGKQLHEFHLSTNYRNSAEIYEFAAAYAQRVGLDADLPDAVRRTGEAPARAPRHPRPRVRHPGRGHRGRGQRAGHRRRRRTGRAPLRGQRLAGVVARAGRRRARRPRGGRLVGRRRAARTGSWCSPASTPRASSSTAIVVVRPQEIEDESATGRATLYVVLTRATQLLDHDRLRWPPSSAPGPRHRPDQGHRANNFDVLRVVGALTVMFAHALALHGRPEDIPVVLGYPLQTLGVILFFVDLRLPHHRQLRPHPQPGHLPGGPVAADLPGAGRRGAADRLRAGPAGDDAAAGRVPRATRDLASTSTNNIRLFVTFQLPGVWADLPYPAAVNGSLWTLFVEFLCYLAAPLLFVFPRLLRPFAALVAVVVVIRLAETPQEESPIFWAVRLRDAAGLWVYFAGGAFIRFALPSWSWFRLRTDVAVAMIAVQTVIAWCWPDWCLETGG